MAIDLNEVRFEFCDYNNPMHQNELVNLIQLYMEDPMGGCDPLSTEEKRNLVEGLSKHPASFVVFLIANDVFAGLTTCFINFSTFKAKPYINIHDVFVRKEFRGLGLGRMLMEKIISIAQERNCCKITLEVRDDNAPAQILYHSFGFEDTTPPMWFWTKMLE